MSEDALTRLVHAAQRRATVSHVVAAAAGGLAAGALLMLAAALCHRFVAPLPRALPLALLLLPVLIGLAAGWRRRPDGRTVAASLDRHFDGRSLIATAWSVRMQAPTPAARLVLDDARKRASAWHAQLGSALPLTASRSTAASVAVVLAAALLLAHPGAAPSGDGDADAAAAAANEAEAPREPLRPGATAQALGTAGTREEEASRSEIMDAGAADAATPVRGRREMPAAPGTGDTPGRAAARAGAPAMDDAGLPVTWLERERRGDTPGAGAPDVAAATNGSRTAEETSPPAALAAARAGLAPYEPVLPPAVAAYARAAARAENKQ
jgi:hypothetical protein